MLIERAASTPPVRPYGRGHRRQPEVVAPDDRHDRNLNAGRRKSGLRDTVDKFQSAHPWRRHHA
jgi:hypothetical protein